MKLCVPVVGVEHTSVVGSVPCVVVVVNGNPASNSVVDNVVIGVVVCVVETVVGCVIDNVVVCVSVDKVVVVVSVGRVVVDVSVNNVVGVSVGVFCVVVDEVVGGIVCVVVVAAVGDCVVRSVVVVESVDFARQKQYKRYYICITLFIDTHFLNMNPTYKSCNNIYRNV